MERSTGAILQYRLNCRLLEAPGEADVAVGGSFIEELPLVGESIVVADENSHLPADTLEFAPFVAEFEEDVEIPFVLLPVFDVDREEGGAVEAVVVEFFSKVAQLSPILNVEGL